MRLPAAAKSGKQYLGETDWRIAVKSKICICIITYKRPELLRQCLETVIALETPPESEFHLVVTDNDSEQSAKPVFDNFHFPFPADYQMEPTKGLPYPRNACLDRAAHLKSTYLLFVDDDMRLPRPYAKDLLAFMQQKNADAVHGKMQIIGDDGKPQKVRRSLIFARRDLLPTNGVLMAKRIYDDWGMRFDLRYKYGMEDANFFYRAHLRGARLYTAEHIAFLEYRPAGRGMPADKQQRLRWVYEGSCYKVALRRHTGGFWRGLFFALRKGLPLLLQILANLLLLPFSPDKRWYKIQTCASKIAGLAKGLWTSTIPGTVP